MTKPPALIALGCCVVVLSVSRSTVPVPFAACTKRLEATSRCDEKTNRRPSGVQTGIVSANGSFVTLVKTLRSMSHIQMSLSSSRMSSAAREPSGDRRATE